MSKAREDLPDPERPVITINLFLGIETLTFFKLLTLAPFYLEVSVRVFKIKLRYLGSWHSPTKEQYEAIKNSLENCFCEEVWELLEQGKPAAMTESVLGLEYWLKVARWY